MKEVYSGDVPDSIEIEAEVLPETKETNGQEKRPITSSDQLSIFMNNPRKANKKPTA